MKTSSFHPDALAELQEQAVFYNERATDLGVRFAMQVQAALTLACSMPGIGSPYRYGTRRVFPKDFPHSIVYRVIEETLVVLAVAPFKRKPGYWRHRR